MGKKTDADGTLTTSPMRLKTTTASSSVPENETPAEVSSTPAPAQQALRTLEWVQRRENLVLCGPSGDPEDVAARRPADLHPRVDELMPKTLVTATVD